MILGCENCSDDKKDFIFYSVWRHAREINEYCMEISVQYNMKRGMNTQLNDFASRLCHRALSSFAFLYDTKSTDHGEVPLRLLLILKRQLLRG